jgi:long-chain acyl-CoA synthetase
MSVIGLYGKNSAKWMTADLACIMSDITSVTLYDTLGEESTSYIIDQTELKTVFCTADHIPQLAKLKGEGQIATLENIVLFDAGLVEEIEAGEDAGLHIYQMEAVKNSGLSSTIPLHHPTSDSIFTICYTSGTTGAPKGVLLNHRNALCISAGLKKFDIDLNETDVHLSYLPLAHVME